MCVFLTNIPPLRAVVVGAFADKWENKDLIEKDPKLASHNRASNE